MAIVIEDGTGKTNSNSYASEAELSAYATERGITITGTAAQLLINAMDWLEGQPFQGFKYTSEQALQWPRGNVVIDGWTVDVDEIPLLLKEAQMEAALGIDGGSNPLAVIERTTKREQVGEISVEYSDGARETVYLTAAENKLKKLLKGSAFGINAVAVNG